MIEKLKAAAKARALEICPIACEATAIFIMGAMFGTGVIIGNIWDNPELMKGGK